MKLTKAQLRQTIEEELASEGFFDKFTGKGKAKKAEEERAQRASTGLEKLLSYVGKTLSDETKALALKLMQQDQSQQLRPLDAIEQAQKKRGEPTWAEESDAVHQKYLARRRGGRRANFGSEDPHSRPQGRVRPSTGAGQLRGSGTSAYGESKDHTMKLNYEKLARLVKEELEVILTDEEANEMFGLNNMVQDKKLKEDCGGAHKRDDDDEEDDELSPDEGGPSGTSAKKDTRPDSELRRDVKEAQLQEADVVYIAKMLLNGLLALHKAGVTPTAIIDALSGAGERERGAMVGLPGFEELPPEVQGAVGAGAPMEEGGSQYTIPPGGFGGRSYGKGSCEGECSNSQNYHQCLEDCKERKRAEQGRSSAKLDKRIGLGPREEGNVAQHDQARGLTERRSGRRGTNPRMKENNLFMTRDKLAEMIRQEMTRTIRRNKENV
jgi:hypothetical protein